MTEMWRLFPFPTLRSGLFSDGALFPVPPDCLDCKTLACAAGRSPVGDVEVCRYGFGYSRIDDERTIVGLACTDGSSSPKRARKRWTTASGNRVHAASVARAVATARSLGPGVVNEFELAQEAAQASFRSDPQMLAAIGRNLIEAEPDFHARDHDLIQLVAQIKSNAEALLIERAPGETNNPARARVARAEGTIFFAAEQMIGKLDAQAYLKRPNEAVGLEDRWGIHRLVMKYVYIYELQAEQKDLRITHTGSSIGKCNFKSDAVGAVVLGVIDNLVKYAPAGSSASIQFSETSDSVSVQFTSLGPKISRAEVDLILLAGVRGAAAQASGLTGQGIGLAVAKTVADTLGLGLTCVQEPSPDHRFVDRFQTTFLITIPRCDGDTINSRA